MAVSRAVHALVLAATARTAVRAARAVADRRAGRDASAQEPPADASADLAALRADLTAAVVQLRLVVARTTPDDEDGRIVQAFETRVLIADAARALATAHQKMLSLYPTVTPEATEATRRLARDVSAAITDSMPDLSGLADRVARWCGMIGTAC